MELARQGFEQPLLGLMIISQGEAVYPLHFVSFEDSSDRLYPLPLLAGIYKTPPQKKCDAKSG